MVSAFYAGAILLNPAPANAPGQDDPIYTDNSGVNTLYYIAEGEISGATLKFIGSRFLSPIAKAIFNKIFRGPGTRTANQPEGPAIDTQSTTGDGASPPRRGISNKIAGDAREAAIRSELEAQYPDGAVLHRRYLLDASGRRLTDPGVSREARELDFVVVENGQVVKIAEVTSMSVDKTAQMAKTERIRDIGECYVKVPGSNTLVPVPRDVPEELYRLP